MNFRQFAFNNVFRNKRAYVAHFLSSAFSVMIFFIYALLLFHPDLKGNIVSSSGTLSMLGTMGLRVSQCIVFIFSFFFLLYSASSFIKLRKKEFGILLLLGMSRKQLNRMLFIENIAIGAAAIIAGIIVGAVFSKLILLISASMLAIVDGLPFYLPGKAILLDGRGYLLLFLLVASFTSVMTRKGTLIELINQSGGNQSKGNQSKGNQSKGNQSKGNQSKGNQTRGNQTKGNQTRGNQTRGNKTRGNQTKGNQTKGNQTKGNQTRGNQTRGNKTRGNQTRGNHTKGNLTRGAMEWANRSWRKTKTIKRTVRKRKISK
ncbi:hypothetical protein CPT76_27935 [Paenibacillus sp. AR247]|nr:hypothetical protein CPT76_27935 [Paenibacillus sp. AR247]